MPIFEFKCRSCGEVREALVKNNDTPPPPCTCGSSESDRLLAAPALSFKGPGFYVNDKKAAPCGAKGGCPCKE